MVLGYEARQSTQDIDALFLPPPEARIVRAWATIIARENGWADNWLNDAAKVYLTGFSNGPVLLQAPGIEVRQPAIEQLLAMKLCAWRDDVDIADASRLLMALGPASDRAEVWQRVVPYLMPGRGLKAQYAFEDLWESLYGNS
jgi:predicted nucleotidyltransferase